MYGDIRLSKKYYEKKVGEHLSKFNNNTRAVRLKYKRKVLRLIISRMIKLLDKFNYCMNFILPYKRQQSGQTWYTV